MKLTRRNSLAASASATAAVATTVRSRAADVQFGARPLALDSPPVSNEALEQTKAKPFRCSGRWGLEK